MVDFHSLEQLLNRASGINQPVQFSTINEIDRIQYRLDNLPSLFEYISTIPLDYSLYSNSFTLIKNILSFRGSLLTFTQIQQYFQTLLTTIFNFKEFFNSNNQTLAFASHATAVAFRFYFESYVQNFDANLTAPFGNILELLKEQETFTIGLHILNNILDVMNLPMNHISVPKSIQVRKIFVQSQLKFYFESAVYYLLNYEEIPGVESIFYLLGFLRQCFTFLVHEEEIPKIKIITLPEWSNFFIENQIPRTLIAIYDNAVTDDIAVLCLDNLFYYSSANDSSWKVAENKWNFVTLITEELTRLMNSELSEKRFLSVSKLLYKFGCILPLNLFLGNDFAMPFFNTVLEFSKKNICSKISQCRNKYSFILGTNCSKINKIN